MPPKKKEVKEEKPILGRFSSHLKVQIPASGGGSHGLHVAAKASGTQSRLTSQ